jgi:hypothetical protein
MRLLRARRSGQAPPPQQCCECGKRINGVHAPHCSDCWLKTDAGRLWQRTRLSEYRAEKRREQQRRR